MKVNVRKDSAVYQLLKDKYSKSVDIISYPSSLSSTQYVTLFKSSKFLLILDNYATRLSCSGTFYDAVSTGTPIIHDSDAVLQEDIDYLNYMHIESRVDFAGIFNIMLNDLSYKSASNFVSSQARIFRSEYELNVKELISWMS